MYLQKDLKKIFLNGKSITLIYPEYKIYTSAIVGGIIPIALGTAIGSSKEMGSQDIVNLFMGGMTSETGLLMKLINMLLHLIYQ